MVLGRRLERLCLDRLQVLTNIVVVLDKAVDLLVSVRLEVFIELGDIHDLCVFEVDRTDNDGVLDRLHLLLDVAGLSQHSAVCP